MSKCSAVQTLISANPVLELLGKRLEEQQSRIHQARSIVRAVNKVLDAEGEVGDETKEQPIWWSLRAVEDLLADIGGKLEPEELLGVTHG